MTESDSGERQAAADRWMRDEADGIPPEKNMGAKAVFFSLEMSADQLATRILAEQANISSEALRMGKISKSEFEQLAAAAAREHLAAGGTDHHHDGGVLRPTTKETDRP